VYPNQAALYALLVLILRSGGPMLSFYKCISYDGSPAANPFYRDDNLASKCLFVLAYPAQFLYINFAKLKKEPPTDFPKGNPFDSDHHAY
jgi:hypothetical protein